MTEKPESMDSLDSILDRNMLTTRHYKPTSQEFDSSLQWGFLRFSNISCQCLVDLRKVFTPF